jgi:hypothetical protein
MFTPRTAGRGSRLGSSVLAALTWCSLLGCGAPGSRSQGFPIEGFVQWEKGPTVTELEGGSLEFEKDGTVVATAAITGDGSFRVVKALSPGKYRVRVVPPATPARTGAAVDPRLQRFETSGLEFTATAEATQVTFQLKKRGR